MDEPHCCFLFLPAMREYRFSLSRSSTEKRNYYAAEEGSVGATEVQIR